MPPRKFNPHPFAYHQDLELRIDSLTNEGRGVARVDGWVVFVSFALPGEQVRARVYRNHKNFSEADLVEVIEASPDRVAPVCPQFGQCGGCQYQHLAYERQLEWKRRQVEELLWHMARLKHPVLPVVASPRQHGYRSKITPHFQKPRNGAIGAIGFLRAGTRNAMVDVPECPIAMPELNTALAAARETARAAPDTFKNGATLLLRAAANGVLTRSDATAIEEVNGVRFEFQAGDFFQNNPFILPDFVAHAVREARAETSARCLVDAYCGSGLFGLSAAREFEEVIGVEISESAVRKATHNAELNDLGNCRFLAADAGAIFQSVPNPGAATVVLVDPPRAGCSEDFLEQLFAFAPRRVVYISCNPATQMRDLARFDAAGFRLLKVQPFDLFPQTKHLECVMTLQGPEA
jgi:tRNA/tmRNA/rRNA uracil-C5-methylase (TrmA/RlmC/RlmD family)